jgi:hypothetical protein
MRPEPGWNAIGAPPGEPPGGVPDQAAVAGVGATGVGVASVSIRP